MVSSRISTSQPSRAPSWDESATIYDVVERRGVICVTVAALVSLCAVLYLLIVKTPKPRTYQKTHLFGYILSLLVANLLQSIGTILNFEWIINNGIVPGIFCSFQGGIQQLGNIGTALWSCMISIHLFNLLFLRSSSSRYTYAATLVFGWSLLSILVVIGPLAIQTAKRGPYFGVAGAWCWIRSSYPLERVFLEFFLELMSAAVSLLLYSVILIRVRGNLVRSGERGRWTLRVVPRDESWNLCFGRDLIDTYMLNVAKIMVWYPVAYTVVLLPVTVLRLAELSGRTIPFVATTICAVFYSLTGLVNVILLIYTQRHFPNLVDLPHFDTPRQKKRITMLHSAGGVTPYTLQRSLTAEKYRRERNAATVTFPALAHVATNVSQRTMASNYATDDMHGRPLYL